MSRLEKESSCSSDCTCSDTSIQCCQEKRKRKGKKITQSKHSTRSRNISCSRSKLSLGKEVQGPGSQYAKDPMQYYPNFQGYPMAQPGFQQPMQFPMPARQQAIQSGMGNFHGGMPYLFNGNGGAMPYNPNFQGYFNMANAGPMQPQLMQPQPMQPHPMQLHPMQPHPMQRQPMQPQPMQPQPMQCPMLVRSQPQPQPQSQIHQQQQPPPMQYAMGNLNGGMNYFSGGNAGSMQPQPMQCLCQMPVRSQPQPQPQMQLQQQMHLQPQMQMDVQSQMQPQQPPPMQYAMGNLSGGMPCVHCGNTVPMQQMQPMQPQQTQYSNESFQCPCSCIENPVPMQYAMGKLHGCSPCYCMGNAFPMPCTCTNIQEGPSGSYTENTFPMQPMHCNCGNIQRGPPCSCMRRRR